MWTVLLLAAATAAPWQLVETKDPMTDKAKVRLSQQAAEGGGSLVLGCDGDDFRMELRVDPAQTTPNVDKTVAGGIAVKGRWRIDSDKAKGITFWAQHSALFSLEPHSNFAKDARKFLRQLEARSRVIFQVEAQGPSTFSFDLSGLELAPLHDCYEPKH